MFRRSVRQSLKRDADNDIQFEVIGEHVLFSMGLEHVAPPMAPKLIFDVLQLTHVLQ